MGPGEPELLLSHEHTSQRAKAEEAKKRGESPYEMNSESWFSLWLQRGIHSGIN